VNHDPTKRNNDESRMRIEWSKIAIAPQDKVLITGAAGFVGPRLLDALIRHGFLNIRCLVRPSSDLGKVEAIKGEAPPGAKIEIFAGNLLSPNDCLAVTRDVKVVYHLAAGRGEKAFADAFMNSVVTTRNLLDAVVQHGCAKRFVSISSFSVYDSEARRVGALLDECCPVKRGTAGDAYSFAKVKQDEILMRYGKRHGIPFVILRPGVVFGPGKNAISGRVGLGTFGLFLHLGGTNPIPLTYVDNCAEAIMLAGIQAGVEGEVFNVVDDNLPTSRQFLRQYKKKVRRFRSVYLPAWLSYLLCWGWGRYSTKSKGQLPPVYDLSAWNTYWKKACFSNEKLKQRLGWKPGIDLDEGLTRFFESCKYSAAEHA
jgi:nucleoside-diphosphate-sugar epimerase